MNELSNFASTKAARLVLCIACVVFCNVHASSAAKLYWTSRTTGSIQRANLDGSEVENIVTGLIGNYGLAVDSAHGSLYWSENSKGTISRANLNGTGKQTLITGLNSRYKPGLF